MAHTFAKTPAHDQEGRQSCSVSRILARSIEDFGSGKYLHTALTHCRPDRMSPNLTPNISKRYVDRGRHCARSPTFGNARSPFCTYVELNGMKLTSFILLRSSVLRDGMIAAAFSACICFNKRQASFADVSTPKVQLASKYPKENARFGRPSSIKPFQA